MTVHKLCLERCLPSGITHAFKSPCANFNFSKEVLRDTFQKKLPGYILELNEAFSKVNGANVSGLAPTWFGGPIDDCVIDGVWEPSLQRMHGGTIPMTVGAQGSHGVPEQWPHPSPTWKENAAEPIWLQGSNWQLQHEEEHKRAHIVCDNWASFTWTQAIPNEDSAWPQNEYQDNHKSDQAEDECAKEYPWWKCWKKRDR